MTKLEPCPFCGCEAVMREDGGDWFVHCRNQGCGENQPTPEEAAADWNRRASTEPSAPVAVKETHDGE